MGASILKTQAAAVAALLIAVGGLGACSKGPGAGANGAAGGAPPDLNASLKPEEAKWRTEIMASDPLCKQTGADQKCKNFNVECKAERDLKPDDAAKGVT